MKNSKLDDVIFDDNSFSIGHTPLVRLRRITDGAPISLLAKLESRNPANSVKDRIGASMIWDAEQRGVLMAGKELIEPTSGNTGIALAFVGAARGYPVTLVMPEGYSTERQHSAKLFGARLLLTDRSLGMYGALLKAEEVVASDPDRYVLLNQFRNPANPAIHFKTTGPEIWDATDGKIDVLIAGIGTGGTITGVTRYIKQTQGKGIISIGVEPTASPTITQVINKLPLTGRAHGIQGLGAGFIPDTLDLTLVDHMELVTDDEALDTCRRLGREEGITAGISSGAVVAVAVRIGKRPEFKGKTIVVVLPDGGERYLSTVLFDGQRAALPDGYVSDGAGI